MWRRRLDLTLKPLLQLDSAHTKDFSAEKDFEVIWVLGSTKGILTLLLVWPFVYQHARVRWKGFLTNAARLLALTLLRLSHVPSAEWKDHKTSRKSSPQKAYFFIRILLDMASSVSVWVFWTCRTQSAGVAKWMFSHRSQDRMFMFSVFSSCWKKEISLKIPIQQVSCFQTCLKVVICTTGVVDVDRSSMIVLKMSKALHEFERSSRCKLWSNFSIQKLFKRYSKLAVV